MNYLNINLYQNSAISIVGWSLVADEVVVRWQQLGYGLQSLFKLDRVRRRGDEIESREEDF